MTLTPEQVAKLPKWARAEFARLNTKVLALQDTLDALAVPAEEANITYRLQQLMDALGVELDIKEKT